MSIRENDVAELLNHWYETKNEIKQLEKKMEKYKKLAIKIMDQRQTDQLHNNHYILKKKEISRTILLKQNIPIQIWKEYSTTNKSESYYISKK